MSNLLQQNSSYAGVVKVVQDEKPNNTNRASLKRNIIKLFLYIAALVFLMWVYFKWQRIPVRNHAFSAEFLASADSSYNRLRASLYLTDPKVLDIDTIYNTYNSNLQSGHHHAFYNYNKDYREHFSLTFGQKNHRIKAYPIYPESSGHLSDFIGLPLFKELSDSCQLHHTSINSYTDLFYFEHLDNDRIPNRVYKKDTISFFNDRIFLAEKNKYFDIDSTNKYPSYFYHFNVINTSISNMLVYNMHHKIYSNITQALVLTPSKGYPGYNPSSIYKVKMPSKYWRFITSFFSMEDISQSYYNLSVSSNTIPELKFRIDFVGTIDCYYDRKPTVNDSIPRDIYIGRNFIEVFKKNDGTKRKDKLVLVKFNDMQNMQTTRLFILGVLITLTLTKLLGVFWRIISNPLMKLWLTIKRYISKLFQKFRKKEAVPENNDQNDDDLPGFYL